MTIRRELLWESETASDTEVRQMERQHIEALRENDPPIGYNRWPKLRGGSHPGMTIPPSVSFSGSSETFGSVRESGAGRGGRSDNGE
jgi:hypothetical protein